MRCGGFHTQQGYRFRRGAGGGVGEGAGPLPGWAGVPGDLATLVLNTAARSRSAAALSQIEEAVGEGLAWVSVSCES